MKSRLPLTAILGGLLLAPMAWSRAAAPGAKTAPGVLEVGPNEVQANASRSTSIRGTAQAPKPASAAPSEDEARRVETPPVGNIALATLHWEGSRARAQDAKGRSYPLTLDRALQQTASQLLRTAKPSRGAVVVVSASDNRVLALAEYPAGTSHADSILWSANTPSASLFKLVTTAALVERAQLRADHRVCSEGGMHRLEARHLEAPTAGRVVCSNFSEILAASRNAAYARLVHRYLAPEDLTNFADRFGFNSPLPADVPAESGRFHAAADPLRFARTATGFVGSSLSALGAAHLGLVIARGGVAHPLQLLETEEPVPGSDDAAITDSNATALPVAREPPRSERVLAPHTASRLREMMEKVVSHGTAADAFRDEAGKLLLPHVRVAGKTGTLGRDEHTASWFVGFAPSRAPKLVVAVLLDNGPVWQTTAKHVASSLMREYFDRGAVARLAAR